MESSRAKFWIDIQLRVRCRSGELACRMHRQFEFLSHTLEICILFEQCLAEIGGVIGKLLQHLNAFLAAEFLFLVGQCQTNKLDLAFFIGFEFSFVALIILPHIFFADGDFLSKIRRAQSNKTHE